MYLCRSTVPIRTGAVKVFTSAASLLTGTTMEVARAGFRELLFLCCAYVLGQPWLPLPAGFSSEDAALQEMVNCAL